MKWVLGFPWGIIKASVTRLSKIIFSQHVSWLCQSLLKDNSNPPPSGVSWPAPHCRELSGSLSSQSVLHVAQVHTRTHTFVFASFFTVSLFYNDFRIVYEDNEFIKVLVLDKRDLVVAVHRSLLPLSHVSETISLTWESSLPSFSPSLRPASALMVGRLYYQMRERERGTSTSINIFDNPRSRMTRVWGWKYSTRKFLCHCYIVVATGAPFSPWWWSERFSFLMVNLSVYWPPASTQTSVCGPVVMMLVSTAMILDEGCGVDVVYFQALLHLWGKSLVLSSSSCSFVSCQD